MNENHPPSESEKLLARILHDNSESISQGPTQTTYVTPHSVLTIGIGKDHVATLVIDDEALEEIQKRLPGHFPSLHKLP